MWALIFILANGAHVSIPLGTVFSRAECHRQGQTFVKLYNEKAPSAFQIIRGACNQEA